MFGEVLRRQLKQTKIDEVVMRKLSLCNSSFVFGVMFLICDEVLFIDG